MLTAFNRELGTRQGRIQPAGIAAPSGEYVFCLGHDTPGNSADVSPGDFALLEQHATITPGTKLLRVRALVRPPAVVPAGHKWVLEIALDDTVKVAYKLPPGGPTRDRAFALNVSKVAAGKHYITVQLRFVTDDLHQYISEASYECGPPGDVSLLSPSVASGETFGSLVFVVHGAPILPSSIASGEAISLHAIAAAPQTMTLLAGIATAYVSGTARMAHSIASSAIGSGYVSGSATITTSYNPAGAALTAFLRDYAGTSWQGTASGGTSGSGNNDFNPGTAPATGAALNGHGTASFDNNTTYLLADGTLDTYMGTGGIISGWVLLKLSGNASTDNILTDNGGVLSLKPNGSGGVALEFESVSVTRAISNSVWALVTFRFDGSDAEIGVNEPPGAAGGASTTAHTWEGSALTGTVRLGSNSLGIANLNGLIAEVGLTDLVMSDTDFNDLIDSYINPRYGLSL